MSKRVFDDANQLFKKGDIEHTVEMIETHQKTVDLNSEDSIRLEILRAKCFGSKGQFNEGVDVLLKVISGIDNTKYFQVYAEAMVTRVEYLFRQNKLSEALQLIEPLQEELEQELNFINSVKTNIFTVNLKRKLGLDKRILEEFVGQLENRRGTIAWNGGDLRTALIHLRKALDIAKKHQNLVEMLKAHNNLGIIYLSQGELDLALEEMKSSLKYGKELKIPSYIGPILGNIGELYHFKGDYDTAFATYLEGLEVFKDSKKNFFKSRIVYELVVMNAEFGKLDLAKQYLTELAQIRKDMETPLVSQEYRIAQAYFSKSQGRMNTWSEAQNLFIEIINEEIIEPDLTMFALKNLCDIVFKELKAFETPEILADLTKYTDKLLSIAQSQNNFIMMAESYWLQSKIALLRLDINLAQELLQKAVSIAEDKELRQLSVKLSLEEDYLSNQLPEWEMIKESHPKIGEIYEIAQIDRSLRYILLGRIENVPEEHETPIMVLILVQGLAIYSKNFTEAQNLDQQLIAGLLSAINSFTQKAFSASGMIERIKHKDFDLLMKFTEPNQKVMVCYAFKGHSYFAVKKLYQLIQTFKAPEIRTIFNQELVSIGSEEEAYLNNIVTGIIKA